MITVKSDLFYNKFIYFITYGMLVLKFLLKNIVELIRDKESMKFKLN